MLSRQAADRRAITRELGLFLRGGQGKRPTHPVRKVYFAEGGVAPPPLAYVTSFPRLCVPLAGTHPMEIAQRSHAVCVPLARGQVLFAARNCWNKPDWSTAVKVLTFLFGKKQIGVSLVTHDGGTPEPTAALKATLGSPSGLTEQLLSALVAVADEPRSGPLDRLVTEGLLHACWGLLRSPPPPHPRKAMRTYETLCLYVQENFRSLLTRESVAQSLALTPSHVSRVFRREGSMRFSDYLTLVRIDRAKFMLKEYGSSLKEVAAQCGFHDVTYFCRVFRRVTKVTPTEYRMKGL